MVQIQWYIIRVVSSIALKNNRTAWSMEEESINRRRARRMMFGKESQINWGSRGHNILSPLRAGGCEPQSQQIVDRVTTSPAQSKLRTVRTVIYTLQ